MPLTTVLSPLSLRKTNLFRVKGVVKVALAQKGSAARTYVHAEIIILLSNLFLHSSFMPNLVSAKKYYQRVILRYYYLMN